MSDKGISETVSENKGRGRPRITTSEEDKLIERVFPDIKSRRGQLNVHYRQRAIFLLGDDPALSWLWNPKADTWQPTILIELGRVEDIERMKDIALIVCHIKPKAKDGATIVRRLRLKQRLGVFKNRVIKAVNALL